MQKIVRLNLVTVIIILLVSDAFAGTVGDIDGDGKIALPEAVYALQVASGLYPNVSASCQLQGKGIWSATSFNECDVVGHNGSYFVCNDDIGCIAADEPGVSSKWDLLNLYSEWVKSGDNIYFDSGNVGIGNTEPESKLTIGVSDTASPTDKLTGTVSVTEGSDELIGSGTTFTTELSMGDYIRVGASFLDSGSIFSVESILDDNHLIVDRVWESYSYSNFSIFKENLALSIKNRNDNSAFVVSEHGMVGIGNDQPKYYLDVHGGGASTTARFWGGGTDTTEMVNRAPIVAISTRGNGNYTKIDNGVFAVGVDESASLRFNIDKTHFIVKGNGNIGVGTASPERNLHIKDLMRLEPRMEAPTNPSEGDIYMDGSDHKLKVYDGTQWRACW